MLNKQQAPDKTKLSRGLIGIAVEETEITKIDGEGGKLYHRGFSIDELAEKPFEHVAQMLLSGEYPSAADADGFSERLKAYRELPRDIINLIQQLTHCSPDTVLQTVVSSLSDGNKQHRDESSLIALMPAMIIAHAALRDGVAIPEPTNLGLAADCLQRLLRRPLTQLEKRIINLDFVLHADHGANASAFAARVTKSTLSDTCRCLTAAMATFSGERHGGAVKAIMEELVQLEDSADACKRYVEERLSDKQPIFGFGHRVYKVEDPRAKLFREAAEALSEEKGDSSHLTKIDALVLAMKPLQRGGIAPNVDLYAAAVYLLLGVKPDQATALFAAARTAGWLAQIREQASGSNVLIRPRLEYKGRAFRELPR